MRAPILRVLWPAVLALMGTVPDPVQDPAVRRVDATDDAAYQRTLTAIRAALPPTEQARLTEALVAITLVETRRAPHPAADPEAVLAAARRQVHGKTAAEVIRLAAELRVQHASVFREAAELEAGLLLARLLNKQRLLQMQCAIDVDGNQRGEAGYFAELGGTVGIRGRDGRATSTRLQLKPVEPAWGQVEHGRILCNGYLVQIYLPGADGVPVPEAPQGGVHQPAPDPKLAATFWCAYAWPLEHGRSGSRVFFICQEGTVLAADNAGRRYSGHTNPPKPDAAYPTGTTGMAGGPGQGGPGNDGQNWQPLEPPHAAAPAPRR